jgi:hypothetical protein
MRVDLGEVELAGDEKYDGANGREAAVAARLALGGLEQAVDGFEETVGLARLRPGDDALQMRADHFGHLLHWLDLRAHHVGGPLQQHAAYDIDLLTLQNFPQLLFVEPAACRSLGGRLRDQGVQIVAGIRRQIRPIMQQLPAQSLEARIGALLDAAGLIDGGIGMSDDVELVEGDLGVGQVLGYAADKGRRHVDGDGFDRLGIATVRGEIGGKVLDGLGITPLGDEEHPPLVGIGNQGDVVVSTRLRGFVGGQALHFREVGLRQAQIDVALADGRHLVPREIHQASDGGEGHLAAQRQDQRLEQQREAGKFPRPAGFDLANTAIRQLDPRHAHLQLTLVLEKVQMPVALRHSVMHRMKAFHTRNGKAAPGDKVHGNGQFLLSGVEIHAVDEPWIGDAQGGFKQLGTHVCPVTLVSVGRASYLPRHSSKHRSGLYGRMRNSAASSHRPAYRPIPGVKGSLRRASPALDPRPRATVLMHRYPLEIQERPKYGLKLGEVMGQPAVRKPRVETKKIADKPVKKPTVILYRHPENPALTWTGGRGRPPKWIKDWEATGRSREEARVAGG